MSGLGTASRRARGPGARDLYSRTSGGLNTRTRSIRIRLDLYGWGRDLLIRASLGAGLISSARNFQDGRRGLLNSGSYLAGAFNFHNNLLGVGFSFFTELSPDPLFIFLAASHVGSFPQPSIEPAPLTPRGVGIFNPPCWRKGSSEK